MNTVKRTVPVAETPPEISRLYDVEPISRAMRFVLLDSVENAQGKGRCAYLNTTDDPQLECVAPFCVVAQILYRLGFSLDDMETLEETSIESYLAPAAGIHDDDSELDKKVRNYLSGIEVVSSVLQRTWDRKAEEDVEMVRAAMREYVENLPIAED